MVTKSDIISVLKHIPDPELQISVYDLGLIYDITIGKKGDVHILMTLTSVGCPLFSTIESEIEKKVKKVKGVTSVTTDVIFDPPWSVERMSTSARKKLGI